ncbi:MAG: PilN domain-containing protein [Negativicutes bacterium]|nr:PilN domain-containing protein [Negativicutes bacterium]
MLRINLLPTGQRLSSIRFWPTVLAVCGSMVAVFALTALWQFGEWLSVERQFARMQQHYNLLRPVEDRMAQIFLLIERENIKGGTLLKISNERQSMAAILTSLSSAAPARLWLSEVSNYADPQSVADIDGHSGGAGKTPTVSPAAPTDNPKATTDWRSVAGVLTVRGIAADFKAVAAFIDNLSDYPLLKNAVLVRAGENPAGRGVSFEIRIDSRQQ